MQDHYKVLHIERQVEPLEIKKAYFKMVRKFPPDRYPNEFMDIRSAYEILIDPHTRQQYDICDNMPLPAKLNFDKGKQLLEKGFVDSAIPFLEAAKALYPNYTVIDALLGEAYLKNENSGKAINIFESLVEIESQNASFAGKLAHAYLSRGWHKKATVQYKKALLLDEDNISLWNGYIESFLTSGALEDAQKAALDGIKVSQKNGWNSLGLYYHIIQIDTVSMNFPALNEHLDQIKKLAHQNEEEKENVAWFLMMIGKFLQGHAYIEESINFAKAAYELSPNNSEIQKNKKELDEKASLFIGLGQLEQNDSVEDLTIELLDFELARCHEKDCFECLFKGLSLELELIMERDTCSKDLRLLKTEYPQLFNLKKQFFNELLMSKNTEKLFSRRHKEMEGILKKRPDLLANEFDVLDESDVFDESDMLNKNFSSQPYIREEEKIGRNDPCPCGSGKKYKKCCMK
ncbi:DnaJ domain-containing protein [Fusibacter sp. 3D3]|uniref:DnaJ domain-containing protein n=1 Tax=Fusibacter sp. 3D3 TaxID=1048380 RepID=UPI0008537F0C|nr:protein export cytoplasm protein SecA ATPase RNA helicase [Fusibacter sp. 3D3]